MIICRGCPPELGLQTRMTNRADRGLTMFAKAGRMSEADFIAVKWDKFYDLKAALKCAPH